MVFFGFDKGIDVIHKKIVDRLNKNRFDEIERRASPWFWVAVVAICILVMVVQDSKEVHASAQKERAQHEFKADQSAKILADLMNGRRYSVDGKVLSCKVQ